MSRALVFLLALALFLPVVSAGPAPTMTLYEGQAARVVHAPSLGDVCWDGGLMRLVLTESDAGAELSGHLLGLGCAEAAFSFQVVREGAGWRAADARVARGSFAQDSSHRAWVLSVDFGPCAPEGCDEWAGHSLYGHFDAGVIVL